MSDRSGELEKAEVGPGLGELYRQYSAWLTTRLRRRFGDEAEDLVQEAWLRATAYSKAEAIRHPRALLLRIAENLAIDRRRRAPPAACPLDLDAHCEPATQVDLVLLKQIVLTMPVHLRDVFVLSRFAHLEYQEIAERLGLPLTTVQWRMRKAVEYCAARLGL